MYLEVDGVPHCESGVSSKLFGLFAKALDEGKSCRDALLLSRFASPCSYTSELEARAAATLLMENAELLGIKEVKVVDEDCPAFRAFQAEQQDRMSED